jgi:uncharacterized protein (DUF4213/DUF364 family)
VPIEEGQPLRETSMTILDDLLQSLPEDAPVRTVTVGAHWTLVCSRRCGLASTLMADKPHGHARVRDVGRLHLKSACELAQYARSEDLLEASIGVAAINSLLAYEPEKAVELNAADVLTEKGRDRKVALVGHFPFIPVLRRAAKELWVFEQHPSEGEFPAGRADELLPRADVLAITGTALINHSLDQLMGLARADALVMVLGPSTPLSPVLFDHGATLLSGAVVVDEAAALRTITQGAVLPQVEGLRLLTIAREAATSH